jgi:hypothetical protein
MEPISFCCLGRFDLIGLEALEVLGSIGVLRGCEMPGVFDDTVEGLVFWEGIAISGGG